MKHRYDSDYWNPERRRRETRDALISAVLIAALLFGAVLWVNAHDARQQVHRAPPACTTVNATQAYCPH